MRKLAAAELLIFAASLTATRGTFADEPPQVLASVNVYGGFSYSSASINFGWWSGGFLNVGVPPSNLGQYGGYISASNLHALECAKAYTTTGPGANQGAPVGHQTWIVSNYGWRDDAGNHYETTTSTPPVPNATQLGGTTSTNSMIFLPGAGGSMAYLIQNISHEWAHQWGALDLNNGAWNDAYAIGQNAMNAYLADNGAKCGGL